METWKSQYWNKTLWVAKVWLHPFFCIPAPFKFFFSKGSLLPDASYLTREFSLQGHENSNLCSNLNLKNVFGDQHFTMLYV